MDNNGMMAVVRSLPDAGLAVTLVDRGRRFTLVPREQHIEPGTNQDEMANSATCDSHQERDSNQWCDGYRHPNTNHCHDVYPPDRNQWRGSNQGCNYNQWRDPNQGCNYNRWRDRNQECGSNQWQSQCDNGVQATDDRYISTYKMAHCHASPTSPTVEVTEFPPQRPGIHPGQGNFDIGGIGSGESDVRPRKSDGHRRALWSNTAHSHFEIGGMGSEENGVGPRKSDIYNGGTRRSSRGPVFAVAPSQPFDSFASSLRKYPNLSPDRSSEMIEKLITYSRDKHSYKTLPVNNESRIPRDQRPDAKCTPNNWARYDTSPVRERFRRPQAVEEPWMRSTFARTNDVRFLQDISRRVRNRIRGMDKNTNNRNELVNMTSQATIKMVSKGVATEPRPSTQQINVAIPTTPTNDSEDVNVLNLRKQNADENISKVNTCKDDARVEYKDKCLIKETKENIFTSLVKDLGVPIDDTQYKTGTNYPGLQNLSFNKEIKVEKMPRDISSNSSVLNKTCGSMKQKDKYLKNINIIDPSPEIKNHNLADAVKHLVNTVISRNGSILDPLEKDFIIRYLVQRLGAYDNTVANHWKYKSARLQSDILELLNKPDSKTNATIIINKLTDLLIKKIRRMYKRKWRKNLDDERTNHNINNNVNKFPHTHKQNLEEFKNNEATALLETFVVIPTFNNYGTANPITSQSNNNKSFKYDDQYIERIRQAIKEWLNSLDIPNFVDKAIKDKIVNDMSNDIYERHNYLTLNHSFIICEEKELDYLKYLIFKCINKFIGNGRVIPSEYTQNLWDRLKILIKLKYSINDGCDRKVLSCILNENLISCRKVHSSPTTGIRSIYIKEKSCIEFSKDSNKFKQVIICNQNSNQQRGHPNKTDNLEQVQELKQRTQIIPTQKSKTEQCCINSCFSIDSLRSREMKDEIYEDYKQFIKDWVKEIPIASSTPEEETIAEKARLGIHNGIWKAVTKLNSDPAIYSNLFLYEDLLESEIDDLIDCLPQTEELKAKKHLLKVRLIQKTTSTIESLYKNPVIPYKDQLLQNIQNHLQSLKLDEEENMNIRSLVLDIVENYIVFVKYIRENKVKADIYSTKIFNCIEKLFDVFAKLGNKQLETLTLETIKTDILRVLQNVNSPTKTLLESEADNILISFEIDQWLFDLPLGNDSDNDNEYETKIQRDQLLRILKETDDNLDICNENTYENLRGQICQFLEQLPLVNGENINLTFMADELLNRINNMRQTNQGLSIPKCARIIESKNYDVYRQNMSFNLPCINTPTPKPHSAHQIATTSLAYQVKSKVTETEETGVNNNMENNKCFSTFNAKPGGNNLNLSMTVLNGLNRDNELRTNKSNIETQSSDIYELCNDGEIKYIKNNDNTIGCQTKTVEMKTNHISLDNSVAQTSFFSNVHNRNSINNNVKFCNTRNKKNEENKDIDNKCSIKCQTSAMHHISTDISVNRNQCNNNECACTGTCTTCNVSSENGVLDNTPCSRCRFRDFRNRFGPGGEILNRCPSFIPLFYPYPCFM